MFQQEVINFKLGAEITNKAQMTNFNLQTKYNAQNTKRKQFALCGLYFINS